VRLDLSYNEAEAKLHVAMTAAGAVMGQGCRAASYSAESRGGFRLCFAMLLWVLPAQGGERNNSQTGFHFQKGLLWRRRWERDVGGTFE